jgi:arginine/lysine/ornithine decarboxylase
MPASLSSRVREPALAEHLRDTWAADAVPFHMPGHKGGVGAPALGVELLGRAAYEADVSELGGFDYLHGPESALREAQAWVAATMGASRSWFLINGATVGNIAAICATVKEGDSLLMARDSHRSVYAGIWASGARPLYLPPIRNDTLDGLFGVDPREVERALAADPSIRAVHITSPSMYGFTVPVAEIAAITAAHDVPLIVDEAHGTHFAFHPRFPTPALTCGADLVVHSPHKTIGALTQAALLHLEGDRVDPSLVDRFLQMLQSSSPSALLLVSLATALDEMAREGQEHWARTLSLADHARDTLARSGTLVPYGTEIAGTPGITGFDPVKLAVDTRPLGMSGYEAQRWLRAHRRIDAETADVGRLVFSITMADTAATVEALLDALSALSANASEPSADRSGSPSFWPSTAPVCALTPRAAANVPEVPVALAKTVGRVAAEMIVPYPPGIPLLVPGEVISAELVDSIVQLLGSGCRVVGMSDAGGATLRCTQ